MALRPESNQGHLYMETLNGNINCQFLDPVNKLGNTPGDNEIWNFKNLTCTTTATSTTETSTMATSTLPYITYGETLIAFFIFLLILGKITGFIINKFIDSRPINK